jgi:thiamine kinase-like enzyme
MAPHDPSLSSIERLSREIVPGTGALGIQRLSAGLLNETYRVIRDGNSYALRVSVAQPLDLGMDRSWEARILGDAGRAALAPPLLHADPERGVLLTGWVSGRSWSAQEAAGSVKIRGIAELLRRVHGLRVPAPARVMSPKTWVDLYEAALSGRVVSRRETGLRSAAGSRLAELANLPTVAAVVCHSDLHSLNLIEGEKSLILLDWEYAHVSEPLWDLAGWSANNDFGDEAQRELLLRYGGTAPTRNLWIRFRLLIWLYDYVCLLWSELYLTLPGNADSRISERATELDARLHLPAHYSV